MEPRPLRKIQHAAKAGHRRRPRNRSQTPVRYNLNVALGWASWVEEIGGAWCGAVGWRSSILSSSDATYQNFNLSKFFKFILINCAVPLTHLNLDSPLYSPYGYPPTIYKAIILFLQHLLYN